jgi:hypothetical protein
MSEIVKKDPTGIDNFAGWEDGVEGDDHPEGAGIIQGTLVKFTNEAAWVTREGDELPANLEFIAVDVGRVVQKWQDQQPVETIILQPHQKFPDVKAMNEATPKEEWVKGPDGKMRGPWQGQHILYWLDPKTLDKYTYPTGTDGGRIAIGKLREKIVWMRRLRGQNVYPVITLSDTFFPTRYGGRQRPHFVIVRWVRLGGEVEALPVPTPLPPTTSKEQLNQFAKPADELAPQTTSQPDLPLNEVKEPSLAEEMDDKIPDFGNENAESPQAAAPPLPNSRRNLKKPPAKTGASPKRPLLSRGLCEIQLSYRDRWTEFGPGSDLGLKQQQDR